MSTSALNAFKLERVAIDNVLPNTWNPNKMSDATFDRLVEEIDDVGYLDPIQVVPLEDGKYRILGGEHRWRAMRNRGEKDIDVLVLIGNKWNDEDLQKFATVRLNIIKGNLDPKKFAELYTGLSARHADEALKTLMGFTDAAAFESAKSAVVKAVVSEAGLDGEMKKKVIKAASEAKSVAGLSGVINEIMSKHGTTLDRHFMIFVYGGKRHVLVDCDAALFATVRELTDFSNESGASLRSVFASALNSWKERVEVVQP